MSGMLAGFTHAIATSPLHDYAVQWLRTVPGLPPIVQTVHILSVACIMGSIVFIDLRVLGLAVPSQTPAEMIKRLMPWVWSALVLLFLSGSMFVVTRPARYFANPVFGLKFALLLTAVVASVLLARMHRRTPMLSQTHGSSRAAKMLAGLSLLAWLGVVMAGRWIAYADYLFSP